MEINSKARLNAQIEYSTTDNSQQNKSVVQLINRTFKTKFDDRLYSINGLPSYRDNIQIKHVRGHNAKQVYDKISNLVSSTPYLIDYTEDFFGKVASREYFLKVYADYWTYIFDIVDLYNGETMLCLEIVYYDMTFNEMLEEGANM